ncbi:MAG: hypothetical protein GXO48_08315 [Chlorobi bacterium]|nr:hypothetical protein [Chlorobiota bacterium]
MKPFGRFNASWLKPLKNKYVIAILIFIIWAGFIDEYSIYRLIKVNRQLNEIDNQIMHYSRQTEELKQQIASLDTLDNVIRFAREQYLMSKDNEDVFLIKE